MILNNICFRDYETGSKNKYKCQPIQLAAVMIDLKRLEVIEDSLFESTLKPFFTDEECEKHGVDPIEDEALKKNGFTREELKDAPDPKLVWQNYCDYLKNYNLKGKGGGKWDAPSVGGYNNSNFDNQIDVRMCEKYGPKLDEWGGWSIYHPFNNFDAMQQVQNMFHAKKINPFNSISMDAMREYFGYSTENAHKADVDVLQGADMLIRFLKLNKALVNGELDLPHGKKIKFKGCVGGKL
jgi:DNA polymerase III epsilon subunit-like protein